MSTWAVRPISRLRRQEALGPLCSPRSGLRISVYLPVYPSLPRTRQNPLLEREGIDALIRRLDSLRVPSEEADLWCDRLRAVADAIPAPGSMVGTLAVFLDDREACIFPLSSSEPLLVAVGERYRLRPLLSALRRERSYALLALSEKRVAFFEGSSCGLHRSQSDLLPSDLASRRTGGPADSECSASRADLGGSAAVAKCEIPTAGRSGDLEGFHRAVAEAARKTVEGCGDPLILAAEMGQQSRFRAVAGIPSLVPEGIEGDPDLLTPRALHARAWPIVSAAAERQERDALAGYRLARERGSASEQLGEVAASAVAGRIDNLWIASDPRSPGRVDPSDGRLLSSSCDDDVLDDLAAIVLHQGGKVLVVDEESMPGSGLAAARYR